MLPVGRRSIRRFGSARRLCLQTVAAAVKGSDRVEWYLMGLTCGPLQANADACFLPERPRARTNLFASFTGGAQVDRPAAVPHSTSIQRLAIVRSAQSCAQSVLCTFARPAMVRKRLGCKAERRGDSTSRVVEERERRQTGLLRTTEGGTESAHLRRRDGSKGRSDPAFAIAPRIWADSVPSRGVQKCITRSS